MATYNAVPDMAAITKNVYNSKGVVDLVPKNIKVFFDKFTYGPAADTIGYQFVDAINVSSGSGLITGPASTGPLTFDTPIAGKIVNALVDGYQIGNRQLLDYNLASRAKANNAKAFEDIVVRVVKNLTDTHRRRQVMNYLYGKTNLGVIQTGTASATQTITNPTWAPGVWWFSNDNKYDIVSADLGTKRNSSPLVLSNYVLSARTVTFDASVTTTTGDIVLPAGSWSSSGGGTNTESMGLEAILNTAVTATTLFGIDQSTYPVFRPNVFDCSNDKLDLTLLDAAANTAYQKGYMGDFTLFCSPGAFSDLAAQEVTRIRLTGGQVSGEAKVGYNRLKLLLQAGWVDVVGSPWIKNGIAFLVADDTMRRLGSVEFVHGDPRNLDTPWFNMQDVLAYQTRSYSLNTLYTSEPAYNTLLINITNTHD